MGVLLAGSRFNKKGSDEERERERREMEESDLI